MQEGGFSPQEEHWFKKGEQKGKPKASPEHHPKQKTAEQLAEEMELGGPEFDIKPPEEEMDDQEKAA